MTDEEQKAFDQLERMSAECKQRNEAVINEMIAQCLHDPTRLIVLAHVCQIISDVHTNAHAKVKAMLQAMEN